jgi:hypothetical protein
LAPAFAGQPDPPVRHDQASPTGYPSSLRLLNTFKTTYPLEKFVIHEFPVYQVDKAMAQAFDIDARMKSRVDTKRRGKERKRSWCR